MRALELRRRLALAPLFEQHRADVQIDRRQHRMVAPERALHDPLRALVLDQRLGEAPGRAHGGAEVDVQVAQLGMLATDGVLGDENGPLIALDGLFVMSELHAASPRSPSAPAMATSSAASVFSRSASTRLERSSAS